MHNFKEKCIPQRSAYFQVKIQNNCIPQRALLQGFIKKLHISSIFWHNSKVHIVKDYKTEGCIAQGTAVFN